MATSFPSGRLLPLLPLPVLGLLLWSATLSAKPAASTPAPAPAASTSSSAPAAAAVAPAQLNPARGAEIGLTYEAFLSPLQEPDEEANTPASTPAMFKSTAPSLTRDERAAAGHRAHATLRFSRDLSRAYVDVDVDGVKIEDINMFHIHCGKPGILGPIIVDFSQVTDIQKNFADGLFSVDFGNSAITAVTEHSHGAVGAFTAGCVIPSGSLGSLTPTKVSTVAGLAAIAAEGELYFNLHTLGQTYYGDIRGQLGPVLP